MISQLMDKEKEVAEMATMVMRKIFKKEVEEKGFNFLSLKMGRKERAR